MPIRTRPPKRPQGQDPFKRLVAKEHMNAATARARWEEHKAHGATGNIDDFECRACGYQQFRQ